MMGIVMRVGATLAVSVLLLAETENPEVRAFQDYWENREVYLLISRDQGRKRGFRKIRHLEFFTGRGDTYHRGATVERGEVWFELHTVRAVKCAPEHYEIRLNRPAYPNEPVFGSTVSLILDIKKGEVPLTPQVASDILATVVIEKEEFPRVLWIGEGPYQQVSQIIDLSWLRHITPVRPGMAVGQLTPVLGPPLEMTTIPVGQQSYRYWWYFGYRFFAITKGEKVMYSSILYF
ncbi:hypothetical protein MYX82_01705 [Acidobacteria bacterium AH-259-D05]|nr:hypothetical protein [Acidobacteria bacterium AH-259-D05]